MLARNLKALSIDDDTDGSLIKGVDPYEFEFDGIVRWRIDAWATALKLWSRSRISSAPDLILGDVLFECDKTTPFARAVTALRGEAETVAVDTPIPTGLSHLKPFAALARATGKPIGIAIHTRNADLWRRAWAQNHPVGYLAAHEIGELAAILGDDILAEEGEEQATKCFQWLSAKHASGFEEATCKALNDYRRRLLQAASQEGNGPRIFVPQRDWVSLYQWTKERAAGDGGDIPQNITVPLLYANGTTDEIRLASMFADVSLLYDSLPAGCFDPEVDRGESSAWDLDADGRPSVGRFISELGEVNDAYLRAVDLIEPFAVFPRGKLAGNIGDAAADFTCKRLVLGLAICLQIVRWEFERYRAWVLGAAEQGWNPLEMKLAPKSTHLTLTGVLDSLATLCSKESDPFQRREVLEGVNWPDPQINFTRAGLDADSQPVIEYFTHLVRAKVLQKKVDPDCPGDMYVFTGRPFAMKDVPVPVKLPFGFVASHDTRLADSDLDYSEDSITRTLKDSLGYGPRWGGGADNWAAVPAMTCDAFLPSIERETRDEKRLRGRPFLTALLNGDGPAWLCELLQIYAEDHCGFSQSNLPVWLRRSSNF